VGGTLIKAWASRKSFVARDDSGNPGGGKNPTADFKGKERKNDSLASSANPYVTLYKKSEGDESRLCYMAHALMENRLKSGF